MENTWFLKTSSSFDQTFNYLNWSMREWISVRQENYSTTHCRKYLTWLSMYSNAVPELTAVGMLCVACSCLVHEDPPVHLPKDSNRTLRWQSFTGIHVYILFVKQYLTGLVDCELKCWYKTGGYWPFVSDYLSGCWFLPGSLSFLLISFLSMHVPLKDGLILNDQLLMMCFIPVMTNYRHCSP